METIFKTREIRWFFPQAKPGLEEGLKAMAGQSLSEQLRTDWYLWLPETESVGIKIREGRLEIKRRIGGREPGQLIPQARGYVEKWVKYGFPLGEAPVLPAGGTGEASGWVAVTKWRKGIIGRDTGNAWEWHPIGNNGEAGMQVEYTRVEVQGKTIYTCGLEWPAEAEMNLDEGTLHQLFGTCELGPDASMGYAAFLARQGGSPHTG